MFHLWPRNRRLEFLHGGEGLISPASPAATIRARLARCCPFPRDSRNARTANCTPPTRARHKSQSSSKTAGGNDLPMTTKTIPEKTRELSVTASP
jgi:hypothetical protein